MWDMLSPLVTKHCMSDHRMTQRRGESFSEKLIQLVIEKSLQSLLVW